MAQDLLLDENGDLLIQNGDFVIGDSSYQDVKMIIQSAPGEWKQYPTVGVMADNYVKSPDPEKAGLLNEIQRQLRANGVPLKSVFLDAEGKVKVELR